MVCLYFGLPGAGKTTIMASMAYKFTKEKRYKNVYMNIENSIPGVTVIDNDCIGQYDMHDAAILIDEATIFADSRAYKEFSKEKLIYFLEHRHFNVDIFLFTQQWDGVDRKIRVITDRVYYVYKRPITGFFWSSYYRIPYGILIPDPRSGGAQLGEIIQGYAKPSVLQRIFSHKVFRPRWYKYFDSWARPHLPPLPENYKPNAKKRESRNVLKKLKKILKTS